MAMMIDSSRVGVDYYRDCNLVTAAVRGKVFSDLTQLDELCGRIRLLCLKSGKRPYVVFLVGSARLTREVSDYFGRQIANLLMEYATAIYFSEPSINNILVSIAERSTPAKWRDRLLTFESLEETLREVSDDQGLADGIVDPVYHALYAQ